jgi:gliding motility-associated-like protein
MAGPGQHQLRYEVGQGPCKRDNVVFVTVGDPLVLGLAFELDSICPGEFISLGATGSGGSTGDYRFNWNPGDEFGPSISVNPMTTTTYTVELTDGCTEPFSGQVTIRVSPDFEIEFVTSAPQCFGSMGFVTANILGSSQYEVIWETSPPVFDPTLIAQTGFNYPLRVRDLISGCEKTALAEIPFHPFVRANFILNPSDECLRLPEAEVEIIDQSTGGIFGSWRITDGSGYVYSPGQALKHRFAKVDSYYVELIIENDGGCRDTMVKGICVAPEEPGFQMPNAFSPNNDGHNEVFKPAHIGVELYLLQIFDRWGNVIWETTDPNRGWDGTYLGNAAPEGVYLY